MLFSKIKPKLGNLYKSLILKSAKVSDGQVKKRDELIQYWSDPWDGSNLASSYAKTKGGPLEASRSRRSKFLKNLLNKYVTSNSNILEIGCNVGRNLNELFSSGFKNLSGIEISKKALELMKHHYPEMVKGSRMYNKPVESVIKDFKDGEFDVVFTMAVLQHIHPDSEFIFPEMVRTTKKFIITIEDEKQSSWRHFPRNYKKVFETIGMKQVEEKICDFDVDGLNHNFVARIFEKSA